MKTFSIFSAAIALFGIFAAASPVATPSTLVARGDEQGQPIVDVLTSYGPKFDACHAKYKTICADKCSQTDITNWGSEVAGICAALIVDLNVEIKLLPVGWKFIDASVVVKLVAEILVAINVILAFLLGKCGLLGGLLSIVITLVLSLLGGLKFQLASLIACLLVVVDNLLALVLALVASLLGSATCFVCSLLA